MGVGNGFAGMGNVATGILGVTIVNDQVVQNLRQQALDFAAEYSKNEPDPHTLALLSDELEASLRTIKLFHGLSDKKLEELLSDLKVLVETAPSK